MGFRSNDRGGFGGRSGGRSGGFGGRGGFRDRGSGGFERRRPEMHDVVCDKCKKQCQVPFEPTGDKPVLCSDCFKSNGGSRGSSGGMSSEQFSQINAKLDKILGILEQIEFEELDEKDEDEDKDSEDDEEDEDEDETEDDENGK